MATALPLFAGVPAPADAPARHVLTTHYGTNKDLIPQVAMLYLSEGARVADLTFGQGLFWQKLDLTRFAFVGSDLKMRQILREQSLRTASVPPLLAADLVALPYRDTTFDVVVLDPPYMGNTHNTSLKMEGLYRNHETTEGMDHAAILRDLYCPGLQEAWRILRPGGTVWVKGKDEIEDGEQCWSHREVLTAAERLGFVAVDQFFLVVQANVTMLNNGRRQRHARKNQSWLWVFKRPPTPPVATRGRPKKGSNSATHKKRRDKGYWQARLLRDHPAVYARFMAGELPSVYAARLAAGLVKGR
jgi:hypothetical protein